MIGHPGHSEHALYPALDRDVTAEQIMELPVGGLEPRTLSLKEILEYFIAHRRHVVVRRAFYERRKAQERMHLLEGFRIALDNIDEVIKIIRGSQTPDEAKGRLSERFGLSEIQATAIVDMRLRTLTLAMASNGPTVRIGPTPRRPGRWYLRPRRARSSRQSWTPGSTSRTPNFRGASKEPPISARVPPSPAHRSWTKWGMAPT